MAMSFDDGLNTPPPDYEEAVKNTQWDSNSSGVALEFLRKSSSV